VDGLRFLDDSYNANPDSLRAALETLRSFAAEGRRVAVLGRMGELGATARAAHLSRGAAVQELGIDQLCVVGSGDAELIGEGYVAAGGAPAKLRSFSEAAAAAAFLRASAGPGDLILVKGSRSAAMERVIQPLSP
jgi:UDP-N-acetylmuramoyl-tripeptide--D-alanyl-D-alanine ligase